ncbi:putative TIR domain, P-loop containing nucleoside triphosphate hydrolase [Helianthus annuus]|nr:putative TIR domain, P-loop containing nucleoside triphosphate hydrolase [Helianthus annuus]
MASSSSSSSTSLNHNKRHQYDVFLSFSGEDTRRSFVDHLNNALQGHGIRTFKDDERLQKGKEIKDELLKSIEDSRFCIIVFSKKYAASSWCLDELVKIMECQKTTDQTAFPVFYDVEPTQVRKQSGSVGEAFAKHTNKVVVWKPLTKTVLKKALARHTNKKLGKWRKALKDAANLCGWELKNTADGHEAKVIKLIVERVSLELRSINPGVDENLVGMEQRMQALDPYLEIGTNDVHMVGIKGMGGAGKTTLARAIFDRLSVNFEGRSFVENVRENAKSSLSGLKKLQEQVLRDVTNDKGITISSVHEGTKLIKTMLCGKKVLVVIDDVDHKDQLEVLAGEPNWFSPGSRIIITTRDEQVLIAHKIKMIKDVDLLSGEEAIRLFSRHAFREDIPTHEYEMQSLDQVIRYAAGLPLTIKVLGSYLCGKNKSEWNDALARLKTIPLKESLKVLELSYESLEDDYKEIFLDVACFLRHWTKDSAIRVLQSCGFHATNGLRVLEQKSLIKIVGPFSEGGYIRMHDRIVEMGENIVRREHPDEPNKRSRLWVREEIEHVLADNSGSEAARCTCLYNAPGIVLKALGNMKNLRCLIAYDGECYNDDCGRIDEAHEYFPNSLRYINWYHYPHWCLPKTFEAHNLVALEIFRSKIKQLWEGGKVMKKLKFLNLSYTNFMSLDRGLTPNLERLHLEHCGKLLKLDVHGGCLKSLVYLNLSSCTKFRSLDIGMMPNREWLNLGSCVELEKLDVHSGCLHSLVYLNLDFCKSLKSISFIEQLESLEVLHITGLKLKEFPNYITTGHSINSLLELHLSWNHIEEVPSSIGNLHKLVSLNLYNCSNLKSLPGSICSLQHLRTLNLHDTSIKELPVGMGQLECLENLDLSETHVKHLPGSICMLKRLRTLLLQHSDFLEKLPEDVGQLESLEILHLGDCPNLRELPLSICKLKCLKELKLGGCWRLKQVPDELGNLKCLQLLDVGGTSITHLPSSICNLKCLKELVLYACRKVEKLPEELGNLKCLQSLDVQGSGITHLPRNIYSLKGLKYDRWRIKDFTQL